MHSSAIAPAGNEAQKHIATKTWELSFHRLPAIIWKLKTHMAKIDGLIRQILSGRSDSNVPFSDLRRLLSQLGFDERIRGDHHIFSKTDVEEIINIQPNGAKAKAYQVRQVRNLIVKHKLGTDTDA